MKTPRLGGGEYRHTVEERSKYQTPGDHYSQVDSGVEVGDGHTFITQSGKDRDIGAKDQMGHPRSRSSASSHSGILQNEDESKSRKRVGSSKSVTFSEQNLDLKVVGKAADDSEKESRVESGIDEAKTEQGASSNEDTGITENGVDNVESGIDNADIDNSDDADVDDTDIDNAGVNNSDLADVDSGAILDSKTDSGMNGDNSFENDESVVAVHDGIDVDGENSVDGVEDNDVDGGENHENVIDGENHSYDNVDNDDENHADDITVDGENHSYDNADKNHENYDNDINGESHADDNGVDNDNETVDETVKNEDVFSSNEEQATSAQNEENVNIEDELENTCVAVLSDQVEQEGGSLNADTENGDTTVQVSDPQDEAQENENSALSLTADGVVLEDDEVNENENVQGQDGADIKVQQVTPSVANATDVDALLKMI